jgi:hypothetical protein
MRAIHDIFARHLRALEAGQNILTEHPVDRHRHLGREALLKFDRLEIRLARGLAERIEVEAGCREQAFRRIAVKPSLQLQSSARAGDVVILTL